MGDAERNNSRPNNEAVFHLAGEFEEVPQQGEGLSAKHSISGRGSISWDSRVGLAHLKSNNWAWRAARL